MKLIEQNIEALRKLCNIYNVDRMYLFGSAVTSEFTHQSDIDFLVRFKPIELDDYFTNYMDFKDNLKKLLGREIDLLEEQTLKNPILIKSIDRSKELIYG
ncbi:MAG: nucleotidyltransferase domain-containing protein [Pricia sp.]|nr:nucleotidyltransferase domain-containing protein [Pricia sp.]